MNTTPNGKIQIIHRGILLNIVTFRFVILDFYKLTVIQHSHSLFQISNERNASCELPKFWQDDGTVVKVQTNGCMNSEFDQYGDMEAFGVHPDWERQLSKFASVQDRLREWQPNVMKKIQKFSCMAIKALDIDAIRIDKATQVTVDALASWASNTRACAAQVGKNNFFIPGEVTGGDRFGSLYM
jgi:alpha-1,3-glucan synthase